MNLKNNTKVCNISAVVAAGNTCVSMSYISGLPRSLKILESPGIGGKKIPGPGKSLNLGRGP